MAQLVGLAEPRRDLDERSKTGWRSKAERLMTFRIVAVAVCCCERFGELGGARLHLLEQPRILDRDDGLVGEGLDELDLLSVKWPGLPRVNTPIDLRPSQERDAEHGADIRPASRPFGQLVFRDRRAHRDM